MSLARRTLDGVDVHTVRRLDPRDVTNFRGIRTTTMARTLADLSDVLTAHQLANVIHEAAYRGRFGLEATRTAIERANGRHNVRVLERAIDLHVAGSAGTRSANEDRFLAGLPEDTLVNTRLHGIEVDFRRPGDDLVIELDGPAHDRPRTKREDAERDAVLAAAGYIVRRVKTA